MNPEDECAWCGDARRQHNEKECIICGRFPWERGAYACDGFVEKDELEARQRRCAKVVMGDV
jgi:hypothetical protein